VRANIGSGTTAGQLWGDQGDDVNLKQILGWLVLAFVIWWIIEAPTSAAHVVHNIGTFLTTAATGISHFFSSI
jgi:hypothetical protein